MKSAQEMRALADTAIARARAGEPGMRRYARGLLSEARRRELAEHSMAVGRKNVTSTSYRAFLRARLAARQPGRNPSFRPGQPSFEPASPDASGARRRPPDNRAHANTDVRPVAALS